MRGRFYIDNIDALKTYGVFVLRGGYTPLLGVPSFKNLDVTNWLDESGIEVDLLAPKLQSRSISMTFGFTDKSLLENFYKKLQEKNVHTFNFDEISLTIDMRLVSCGSLDVLVKMGKVTLSFAIDEVEIPYVAPYALGKTRVTQRNCLLGDVDISRYGCWVLADTYKNIGKPAPMKQNLKVDSIYESGSTYFPQTRIDDKGKVVENIILGSQDIRLSLLINARNSTEFWNCYKSLFYYLTSAGEKTIKMDAKDAKHACYYKSTSVKTFEVTRAGTWWMMFDVTLTLI